MEIITEINSIIFNYLQLKLIDLGLDSDKKSFNEIRNILNTQPIFSPEEFAFECFYVICVAGFKQDYAKKMCNKIINFIESNNFNFTTNDLLQIYGNKMKVKAIKQTWDNRELYQKKFYSLKTIEEKVNFLGSLPHIGNITKYHLARNLGLNFVKYDIWIQRLGVALYGDINLVDKVNNSKLLPEIKECCDVMFNKLNKETNEKVGYIDVVLWRSCQKGLLKINGKTVFLDKEFYINS